jgi:short-subunit dehydrogenase
MIDLHRRPRPVGLAKPGTLSPVGVRSAEVRSNPAINIGSVLGRLTFPFLGIYGASKFAVEALTDSLRYEVSQLGVEVVAVQPSAYPTNFFTGIQTPADTG